MFQSQTACGTYVIAAPPYRQDVEEMDLLKSRLDLFSTSLDDLISNLRPSVRRESVLIRARANRLRNLSLSVANLPVELLGDVFELVCTPLFDSDDMLGETKPKNAFWGCDRHIQRNRYNLMATCSQWRLVVKGMERLWRMVKIDIHPPVATLLRQLQTLRLVRLLISGSSRPSDRAVNPEVGAAISLALPKAVYLCSEVIETLESPLVSLLNGPPVALPYLKKLSYKHGPKEPWGAVFNLSLASALEALVVQSNSPITIRPPASSQIRNLSLSGQILPSNVGEILRCTPNLETLVLTLGCTFIPDHIIQLPFLRHLSLCRGQYELATHLPLRLLECPKLESLQLKFDGTDFEGPLGCRDLKYLAVTLDGLWTTETLRPLEAGIVAQSGIEKMAFLHYREEGEESSRWLAELLRSGAVPNLSQIEFWGWREDAQLLLDARPDFELVVDEDTIKGKLSLRASPRVQVVHWTQIPLIKTLGADWATAESEWWF